MRAAISASSASLPVLRYQTSGALERRSARYATAQAPATTLATSSLAEFPAPPNCRKLLHPWRDRQRLPDVQEVG